MISSHGTPGASLMIHFGSQKGHIIMILTKLEDAIAISNLKLSITDPLTHSLTDRDRY